MKIDKKTDSKPRRRKDDKRRTRGRPRGQLLRVSKLDHLSSCATCFHLQFTEPGSFFSDQLDLLFFHNRRRHQPCLIFIFIFIFLCFFRFKYLWCYIGVSKSVGEKPTSNHTTILEWTILDYLIILSKLLSKLIQLNRTNRETK